jgi:hypothetical protein
VRDYRTRPSRASVGVMAKYAMKATIYNITHTLYDYA